MDTVKKGDALEKQVFDTVKELLENGKLFVSSKNCKVFQKKGYYSHSRQSNIIFDIVIEVYRDGAKDYSMLIVFEVKNYEKKVPVDDVEEFDSKINQIGTHNTKAIIVSKSGFQEGALNVAISKKMGLARVNGPKTLDWIAERKDISGWKSNYEFIKGQLISDSMDRAAFFGMYEHDSFSSLAKYLNQVGIIEQWHVSESQLDIPYLTAQQIDDRINTLDLFDCYDGLMLNTDKLCARISSYYDVEFDFDQTFDSSILGKMTFAPLTIYISSHIKPDLNRWRFTLAHEVSHLILHYYILRKYFDERVEDDSLFDSEKGISSETSRRLEHQANMMAAQILLPLNIFGEFVLKYFKVTGIHRNHMFVDEQPVNQKALFTFLTEIEKRFCVSKEMAKIRLKELGVLTETYQPGIRSQLWLQGYRP